MSFWSVNNIFIAPVLIKIEVVKESKPEPKVIEDLESESEVEELESEVIADLMPLQESISSQLTEVEEFLIDILVNLSAELTI